MSSPDLPNGTSQAEISSKTPSFFRWRFGHVVAIVLLGLAFLRLNYLPLWHTDVWGHLTIGRVIVETRSLPETQPLTPFAGQTRYVHFQWLTQATAYLLYQTGASWSGGDDLHQLTGGAEMLRLGYALVVTLRFVFLFLAFQRLSGSQRWACVGIVIAWFLQSFTIYARPRAVGELCFAMLLFQLSTPRISWRTLVFVPLTMVLWANCHGSFPIGLAVIGLTVLARFLTSGEDEGGWNLWTRLRNRQFQASVGFLLISLAGIAILNPYGPTLYWYVVSFAAHPNVKTFVEWMPLEISLRSRTFLNFAGSVLLVTLSWMHARETTGWKPSLLQWMLLAFAVGPWISQRLSVWWLTLAPWLVMPAWGSGASSAVEEKDPDPPRRWKLGLGIAVLLVTLGLSTPFRWLIGGKPPIPLDSVVREHTLWKVASALRGNHGSSDPTISALDRALQKFYPDGRYEGAILASETLGDYLVWSVGRDYPVSICSHIHLFSPEHWQEILTVKTASAGWEEVLRKQQVNLVVIEMKIHPVLAAKLKESTDWISIEQPVKDRKLGRILIALRKVPIPKGAR